MDTIEQMDRKAPTGESKALVKGITALNALAAEPNGLSLVEVAHAADLPKATAHRLLATLASAGLVRALGDGRYGLGSHCLALGQAFLHSIDVRTEAIPEMRKLVEETGETCHLGILSNDHIVYIEKFDSPHPIRMYSRVGATNPASTTSLGKAILAFSPADEVDGVFAAGIPQRTPATVTDPSEARAQLAAIRTRGYAIDDLENEEGIRCVAAPLLDHQGLPAAGISISGPEHRVTRERVESLGAAVIATAERISRGLGYRGAYPPEL
jgi:IclR family acetate operon transcriptional repressor